MASSYTVPTNVGIKAIELYFPKCYIDQEEFAKSKNIDANKYLNSLCLKEMAFCDDNEDVCSLALTVTSALLRNYEIDPNSIGMVVVGTESQIDKSKSVKTTLMPLFGNNTFIEGVDCKNACYGGTQALIHAIDWVYSRYQIEGKQAIVVCADIAIYEPDSGAECTGGAGSIALLVGVDAPLVLEKPLISTHMADNFDFYKPICGMSTEFPRVDGKNSIGCYLGAIEICYNEFRRRSILYKSQKCSVKDFYATIFHCPYFQIVKKAFAEMYRIDCQTRMVNGREHHINGDTNDRNYWLNASATLMEEKLGRFGELNQRIGNMYTASLYASLISVIASCTDDMNTQRVLLFSYGSGLASSMFSLRFDLSTDSQKRELEKMCRQSRLNKERLNERTLKTPLDYKSAIQRRIELIESIGKYEPKAGSDVLFPNTYYVKEIDSERRQHYELCK